MQAIKTKYVGPTNTRGSRIIASCDGGKITHNYAHNIDVEQNHIDAALALCKKLGWDGELATGYLDNGYVHVFVRLGPSSRI